MASDLHLSMMVAMTSNRVIGNGGDMPWGRGIPSDLRRFRDKTKKIGCVIAGRKTYDSIIRALGHPLRDRHTIVLTRGTPFAICGVETAASVEDALAAAARRSEKVCVIGGGEVYKAFLPHATRLYVTEVDAPELEGDTTFPDLGIEWTCVQWLPGKRHDERDRYPTSFQVHERL